MDLECCPRTFWGERSRRAISLLFLKTVIRPSVLKKLGVWFLIRAEKFIGVRKQSLILGETVKSVISALTGRFSV